MADATPDTADGHWAQLSEGLQTSPLEFYERIEAAVHRRSIPDAVIERVEYREAGALSAKRQYLRIRRRRQVFDVCGAPFGNSFFFSWWFAEIKPALPPALIIFFVFVYGGILALFIKNFGYFVGPIVIVFLVPLILFIMSHLGNSDADDVIMMLPFIGAWYEWAFRPITYYRIDTGLMFEKTVQSAVMEVVEQFRAEGGLRPFTELERKPEMRDFFRK